MLSPSLPHLTRVRLAIKASHIGYYATRQHILKNNGNMADVAWVLVSLLLIQGA